MDGVRIAKQEEIILIPQLLQELQPRHRVIQQQGVPGIDHLLVGHSFRQYALHFMHKFRLLDLTGLQVIEQGADVGLE